MWLGVGQPQTGAKVTKLSLGPWGKGGQDRERDTVRVRHQEVSYEQGGQGPAEPCVPGLIPQRQGRTKERAATKRQFNHGNSM